MGSASVLTRGSYFVRSFRSTTIRMGVQKITSMEEYLAAIDSENLAVIDFYAVWCGPCKVMSPEVEKASEDPENLRKGVKFYQVDVDELTDVARKAEISAMPTFHFHKGGKKVFEQVGAQVSMFHTNVESFR